MKKIFTLAFISLAAACLAVSCNEKDEPTESLAMAIVSLTGDSYFADNQATVTANISQSLDKDVTVTLGPGYVTTATKYTIIDDEDLSYSSLVIPAGQTEVSGTVTVDPTEYPIGRYQAQICIAAVDGAMVAESESTVNISLINGQPIATIEFTDNYFEDDGTGEIVLTLQSALDEESTVTIAYTPIDLSSYGIDVLPEDALSFESTVTIPADKDVVSVPVEVDLNKLTASGSFAAGFVISEVSDNLDFDEDGLTFGIVDFILPVVKEGWTATYSDVWTSTRSGKTFDEVITTGMDADQYYICARFPKGTYENDAYISSVLAGVNLPGYNYPASAFVGAYTMAQLASYGLVNQGPAYWDFDHDTPGEYDVYIIGLDAETGEFTGDYSVSTVDFVDASSFLQWSGNWKLSDGTVVSLLPYSLDMAVVLVSTEDAPGYIWADFDEETGGISIESQYIDDDDDYVYYLFPNFMYGGSLDFMAGTGAIITEVTMTGTGEAALSAEPVDDGTGTLYQGQGMQVYALSLSDNSWTALGDEQIALPNTMTIVPDEDESSVKSSASALTIKARERKEVFTKKVAPAITLPNCPVAR